MQTTQTSVEGEDNEILTDIASDLFTLDFKPLKRPLHDEVVGYSEKETRWAIRVFACSSMCFFRDLLRSYLVVRQQKLDAASFLIARALFETVAMANYLHLHVAPLLSAGKYERAWEFLHRASMGSYYARQHMEPCAGGPERPIPLDVGKAAKSLESIDDAASKEYNFLSEFSHPDMS